MGMKPHQSNNFLHRHSVGMRVSEQKEQMGSKKTSYSFILACRNFVRKTFMFWMILVACACYVYYCVIEAENGEKRKENLGSMCDQRARMLQDQFGVSVNHVHALAVLVSTFNYYKDPSAIDQETFAEYTGRTAFERPLLSGVAYAQRVVDSNREDFERLHGWTIKTVEKEPSPIHDELGRGKYL